MSEEDGFDDFVCKKILRKLESKDALKVNNAIVPVLERIESEFGKDTMKRSKEYLLRFQIKG